MRKEILQKSGAAAVRKRITKAVVYTLLGIWGLIVLFPFYFMIITSLKS